VNLSRTRGLGHRLVENEGAVLFCNRVTRSVHETFTDSPVNFQTRSTVRAYTPTKRGDKCDASPPWTKLPADAFRRPTARLHTLPRRVQVVAPPRLPWLMARSGFSKLDFHNRNKTLAILLYLLTPQHEY
jgi:hypothetical protein